MSELNLKPKSITAQNFFLYGQVIEYGDWQQETKEDNLFRIVLKDETARGWRIAYLIVRDKSIDRLEQHPGSYETFEPVRGRSVLYVAEKDNPEQIECFVLDRPVVLNKGIWHGVITLDNDAEIKIFENADVECVYHALPSKLHCQDASPDILADHL